jgi:putative transposon-encoded protein
MKKYDWNSEKNEKLKKEREISFEEIVVAIENGNAIDVILHPNPEKYPGQSVYVVNLNGYVFLIPFVEDESTIFLKTVIPSRKATKQYLKKR